MWWFLRKSAIREPLEVAMSGVRAGERVLQIDVVAPAIAAGIAARVGLNGEAAIVVADDRRAVLVREACVEAGALVDVTIAPFDALPLGTATFDVVVMHAAGASLAGTDDARRAASIEAHRVLRAGGRIMVIESGTPAGLKAMLRPARSAPADPVRAEQTIAALEAAGFHPVRQLADRGGSRFVEGLRRR